MTIRRCHRFADLVSLLSSLHFLKHPYLPKELHYLLHLTILSKLCPYVNQDIVFLFQLSLHWGQINPLFIAMFWIWNLGIAITTKLLRELMQKRNDNYFGFEILCHLNKKLLWKLAAKKLFIFVFVFVLFGVLPKKLKAS